MPSLCCRVVEAKKCTHHVVCVVRDPKPPVLIQGRKACPPQCQPRLPEYKNIPIFSNFGHLLLARFISTYKKKFRTCKYPTPEYSKYFRSTKNLYVCERFLEQIQNILCTSVTMVSTPRPQAPHPTSLQCWWSYAYNLVPQTWCLLSHES